MLRDRRWDAMILDVLMLTARETVADRVRGLEAGEEEETLRRYEGLVLDPVRYEVRAASARWS